MEKKAQEEEQERRASFALVGRPPQARSPVRQEIKPFSLDALDEDDD